MTATGSVHEPLSSFVIALPPGWVRLPAREEEGPLLRSLIEEVVAEALPSSLPRDSAEPWRGEFRKRLTASVVEAREAGALAVYLPIRPVNGVSIPASIVESEIEDGENESPDGIIGDLVDDPEAPAARHTIDGAKAARTETTTTRVQPEGDWPEVTTRQVVYSIESPHHRGRWVVLSFSAVSGDAPGTALTDALVYLFDALMTTLRWTDVPGAEFGDLENRLRDIDARRANPATPGTSE